MISIPHLATHIPDALRDPYTDIALTVADTDWHLERLYGFARALGATIPGARASRYVIDLNRPSNDESLYPGQTTTSLCPTEAFRGAPLYREGCAPDAAWRKRRVATYWQPYHDALHEEVPRLRRQHRNVLRWEAHSISSVPPRLFEGTLPAMSGLSRQAEAQATLAAIRSAGAQAMLTRVDVGQQPDAQRQLMLGKDYSNRALIPRSLK
jgi:N-formylglutamate deformylase